MVEANEPGEEGGLEQVYAGGNVVNEFTVQDA